MVSSQSSTAVGRMRHGSNEMVRHAAESNREIPTGGAGNRQKKAQKSSKNTGDDACCETVIRCCLFFDNLFFDALDEVRRLIA